MAIESSNDPAAFRQFEHQGWESISSGYEQHFTRLTSQAAPATLDAAAVGAGMLVLDVCTGPGMLARAATERGANVIGLDFSAKVVAIAARNVPDADFREADAQSIPFEDDYFDAVVCGFGVIHVPNPTVALSEMRRVLKPGSRLAITTWEAPGPNNGFGLLYGAIKAHGDLSVPLPHGPDFFQFSATDKITQALEETGLQAVDVTSIEQTWEFSAAMELINGVNEGTVRARGLLQAQSESVRNAIFKAVEEGIRRYETSAGVYRIPMPALVGAGMK